MEPMTSVASAVPSMIFTPSHSDRKTTGGGGNVCERSYENVFFEPRREGSTLSVGGESLYALCVEAKPGLILGWGGGFSSPSTTPAREEPISSLSAAGGEQMSMDRGMP